MEGVVVTRHHNRKYRSVFFGKLIAAVFLFVVGMAVPRAVHAATLYLTPSSGTHKIGDAFSVSVYVSSADQAMNAAAGTLSFPRDKLEVTGVSKGGSIFTLWVQEPSISNGSGTVNFEGIVLNPGFTGSGGKIITVNFKVKAAGTADVRFASGSVLANDGEGTNILAGLGSAKFTLGDAEEPKPEEEKKEEKNTPKAPAVSSSSHPDQEKWYAVEDAKFVWTVPNDVTSARLLFDKDSGSTPVITYTPAIREKEVTRKEAPNLADGIWYFHVQLRNANGWGDVAHYRVQIDTQKPSQFTITEAPREGDTESKTAFILDAKDETSGIDHYKIVIDDQESVVWKDDGSHRFLASTIKAGKHTLTAEAVDRAGNALANSIDFTIETINPPTITEYPKELETKELMIVRGLTYPDSRVIVSLEREGSEAKQFMVPSDQDGKFIFVTEGSLAEGTYKLWAEVQNAHGVKSQPSERLTTLVVGPAILRIGAWLMNALALVVPLIALLALLAFIIWYARHKYLMLKKRLKEEHASAVALPHTTDYLHEDIRKQIRMLERAQVNRPLSREETKILKQLNKYAVDLGKLLKQKAMKSRGKK